MPWREAPYSIRVTITTSLGLEPAQPKGRLILLPQSDAEPQGTQLPATALILRRGRAEWGHVGSPLEPSLGCSGLGEIKRTWVLPSRCSVYDLLHEPRLRYLENVHLKPAFRLCVRGHVFTQSTSAELPPNAREGRAGSRGKFLVLEIKGRDRGFLLWSQEILLASEGGWTALGVLGKIL